MGVKMSNEIEKIRRGSTALAAVFSIRLTHLTKERLLHYVREYDFDINAMIRGYIESELLPILDQASREEDKTRRLERKQDDKPVTLT